jgi:hypothetical protein
MAHPFGIASQRDRINGTSYCLRAGILTFNFFSHAAPRDAFWAIETDGNDASNIGTGPREMCNGFSRMDFGLSPVF